MAKLGLPENLRRFRILIGKPADVMAIGRSRCAKGLAGVATQPFVYQDRFTPAVQQDVMQGADQSIAVLVYANQAEPAQRGCEKIEFLPEVFVQVGRDT